MDAAKARAAVVDSEGATALESVRFRGALGVWLGSDEPLPAGVRDLSKALGPPPTLPIPPVFVAPGDVYTYVFTSGTTGLPKAARIRHHRYLLAGAGLQAFGQHAHRLLALVDTKPKQLDAPTTLSEVRETLAADKGLDLTQWRIFEADLRC